MGAKFSICLSHNHDSQSEQTIEELDFEGNFEKLQDSIKRPPISQQLSDLIAVKSPTFYHISEPFFKELNKIENPRKTTFQGGLYIGQISKFRSPQGWGKLYCKNGDVLIGQFSKAKIQGKCFYAKPNGTYHQGEVIDGKLTCDIGIYYCPEFQYIGGFKNNEYYGKGRIIKQNFILDGNFVDGVISYGKLQWKENGQCYIYTGQFNQNFQFHGKGTIEEPYGTYTGEFRFNKKEGEGSYKYLNGNKYVGNYVCGKKKGYGELFSIFEELIYRGEWANDVPERNSEVLLDSPNLNIKKRKDTLKRVDSLRSANTNKLMQFDQKI